MATAARIPSTTTTIAISTSVKPPLRRRFARCFPMLDGDGLTGHTNRGAHTGAFIAAEHMRVTESSGIRVIIVKGGNGNEMYMLGSRLSV